MKGARPLSGVEIKQVLRCCKDIRVECLVEIGMNLGLRVSELVSLKLKDVLNRGRVFPMLYLEGFRTKGNKSRAIPINRRAANAIRRLHRHYQQKKISTHPNDFLFPGDAQGHISIRHVNRLLYNLFDKAELSGRLSSHTLRKTFATLLADQDVNLAIIQELLGHSDISTTRKYIGVGMGNMTKAVRALAKAY